MSPEKSPSEERPVVESATNEGPESLDLPALPPRRTGLWLGVTALVLGLAGFGAYTLATQPDPLRVLVAIDIEGQAWDGSKPAAAVADNVGKGLEKIGFEPVDGGDPKVDKVLTSEKDLIRAARKLEAGFVVSGSLNPEVIEHPIAGGLFEVRTKTTLTVRNTKEARGVEVPLEVWSYGRTKEAALESLAETVSARIFDGAVPTLLDHPVIKEKLKGDIATQARLALAEKYVAARERQLKDVKLQYEKLDQEHAAFTATPFPITYYGNFSEDVRLGGATDVGPVFRSADVSPFVRPGDISLSWAYQLETLAVRDKERKDNVLWSGYHILETPGAAPEGFPIVFSEDLLGFAKTVTVVEKGGASRRLLVHPETRYYNPKVSPGGAYAAFHEKPCRNCSRELAVIDLQSGQTLYRRVSGDKGPDERLGGYAWLSKDELAFVGDPHPAIPEIPPAHEAKDSAEEPPAIALGELRVVKVSSTPALERLVYSAGRSCFELAASPATGQIAMTCSGEGASYLLLVDGKTGEGRDSGFSGEGLEYSRDGQRLVLEGQGDLALVELKSQTFTALTRTPFEERAPRFSPDGKRVYFESRALDPIVPNRRVSVIGSLEVP